jgi:hypothetical protein
MVRSIAAHLLDLGFSSGYLHRWWKFKLEYAPLPQPLADILDDAHQMARRGPQKYEALVVLLSSPKSKSGYPSDWLDAAAVSRWPRNHSYDPRNLRPSGRLVIPKPRRR